MYTDGPSKFSMLKAISSFLVFASCSWFAEVLCSGTVQAEDVRFLKPQSASKYKSKSIKTFWQHSDDIQFHGKHSLAESLIGGQFAGHRSLASGDEGEARTAGHLISQNDEALGGSLGVFHFGYYSIYDAKSSSWRSCNAWTMCGDKLFGIIGSFDYVKRFYRASDISFDLDLQVGLGYQDISKSWYRSLDDSEGENLFVLASIVPMARYRLPHRLDKFSVGAGVGASLALGRIPYERPYNVPLMMAINAEIAYQIGEDLDQEVYLSLRHRCAAFGVLNNVDDSQVGSQWYQIGFRKWY